MNSKPDESAIAVIAKRQTLRKNQTQKRTLTQMQVSNIERQRRETGRKVKAPRERYEQNITVRKIKIKVRKL